MPMSARQQISSSNNNACGSALMPTGFMRVASKPAVAFRGGATACVPPPVPAPAPWQPTRVLTPPPVALTVDLNHAASYALPASSVPSRPPGKSSSLTAPLPRPMYTTRRQQ
eukprot:NODE_30481_length_417_cov_2.175862.p2 GENE.NODE_30481_length_417_cov_2.175862~~NODE_30481_length_417_cov_2.175862.p2  ORF type:complete len:112 (+),score=32.03 NODE_30481_length_417_cov_2.175862:25-360(+)